PRVTIIPPPLAGEVGTRSVPGGGCLNKFQNPTRRRASRGATLPFQGRDVTFTFVPARTAARVFTSPAALAKTLHGLARRVSSPRLMGVRPKPMAIAGPAGQ